MSKSVKKLSVLVLAFFAFVALSLGAFVFQAKADVTTSNLITIASAAEVRLDDAEKTPDKDDTGIRFVFTAQKAAIEANYEGYEVSYGAVLIPTALLGGEELDAAVKTYGTYNVLDIPAVNTIGDDEVVKFAAVLTNIDASFYNTEISARGYAKLTKGEEVIYLQTEDVVSRSFGYVVASKIAHGNPTPDEKVILDGYFNNNILPAVKNELHGAELASFDSRVYETLFSHGRGSAAEYSIEYLDSFSGKTGVIKISGTAASTLVLHLTLPKAMTPTRTGTQTAGGAVIPQKDGEGNIIYKNKTDEEGNPVLDDEGEPVQVQVDRIFDLTGIVADMYVASAGSSAFGFFQSIYDGNQDAGWGGKNFAPTLDVWKDYALEFITSDTLRFAVAAGDFEFYIAGIYQGDARTTAQTRLAETLGENELANFDSDEYLKLITNDPVYGGTPSTKEIGTFHGKDNVLKVTKYSGAIYKAPIYLPKNPTGDKITVQVYIEGGSGGFRFGLLGINNDGWFNATPTDNHGTNYATNKWITLVFYGFANFESAKHSMLRFATDGGTAPDAIYIAGIWDGDQSAAILGREIVSTLGENELANFNSELYLELISDMDTYNAATFGSGTYSTPNKEIGTFHGKDNVLKLTDANANCSGSFRLLLPKTPTQTTITLQLYLVANANDATTPARFGLFKQEGGGWDDTAAGTNHKTNFPRGEWITIIFTEIDTTGTYSYLRFMFEKNIDEVYIAGIWDGDQVAAIEMKEAREAVLPTLGANELLNFKASESIGLVVDGGSNYSCEITDFAGKEDVLKVTAKAGKQIRIYLAKDMTGNTYAGHTNITIQVYVVAKGAGNFGCFQTGGTAGWNGCHFPSDTIVEGGWANYKITPKTGNHIIFYSEYDVEFYVSTVMQGWVDIA